VLEKFEGAEIVYGDTDSIFVNFNPKDTNGVPILNIEGVQASINLGIEAEKYIQQFLKAPHKLEYEKTFWPFILNSKKRYVGNKYEFDITKYKRTEMGLATKRRDYAPIVKYVMNGALEIIMNDKNLEKAIEFSRTACKELLDKKFPMDMLVITKSLRSFYKNPDQIAHKVLADRIGKRDPGNKPKSSDRIPYVYIEVKCDRKTKMLQGNRIETPQFINENKLRIDYKYYITNQIMKPIGQIFALNVEKIAGYKKPAGYYKNICDKLILDRGEKKALLKVRDLRYIYTSELVFGDIIRVAENKKNNIREITSYFTTTKKT
jgi:DNA polymerase elongation subunit (family B)